MKRCSSLMKGVSAVAAAGLLLTLALGASAQDAVKKAPAAKAPSACKGLEEAACRAKATGCAWIAPKSGKQKPYCRSTPAKK